jgi:hypothetical protein
MVQWWGWLFIALTPSILIGVIWPVGIAVRSRLLGVASDGPVQNQGDRTRSRTSGR